MTKTKQQFIISFFGWWVCGGKKKQKPISNYVYTNNKTCSVIYNRFIGFMINLFDNYKFFKIGKSDFPGSFNFYS